MRLALSLSVLLFVTMVHAAPDWPDKHGPTFDGVVPPANAEKLPLEWGGASGKNIAWKTPLEGEGHSTPVIGDNTANSSPPTRPTQSWGREASRIRVAISASTRSPTWCP